MDDLIKGLSCKGCFNCLTRTFYDKATFEIWIADYRIEPDGQAVRWNRLLRTGGGLRLYWCKLENQIRPVITPPWWRKTDVLGCLRENV